MLQHFVELFAKYKDINCFLLSIAQAHIFRTICPLLVRSGKVLWAFQDILLLFRHFWAKISPKQVFSRKKWDFDKKFWYLVQKSLKPWAKCSKPLAKCSKPLTKSSKPLNQKALSLGEKRLSLNQRASCTSSFVLGPKSTGFAESCT